MAATHHVLAPPKNTVWAVSAAPVATTTARASFLLAEASLNAPFRQLMKEAELRVASVVGDLAAIGNLANNLEPADVSGTWLLLKAAVATWEAKFVFDGRKLTELEAEVEPKLDQIVKQQKLVRTTQDNMAMWQEMCAAYVANPTCMAKLRPELAFLEKALGLDTDSDIRTYGAKEFCGVVHPMGEAELRERVRALQVQIARLNPVNYGALATQVGGVEGALVAASPEEAAAADYYRAAQKAGKLDFETYEMPRTKLSALRDFERDTAGAQDAKRKIDQLEKPQRPTDLSWYDAEMVEEQIPDFSRTTLDESAEDPEDWDTTQEVRRIQAELDALLDGKGGKGEKDILSEDDLAMMVSDGELAATEARLEELLGLLGLDSAFDEDLEGDYDDIKKQADSWLKENASIKEE